MTRELSAAIAKKLAKLGIGSRAELVFHLPLRYEDETVLTPLAANDLIDVRVTFATNDGYVEADQSHFWGHYVP